MVLGGVLLVLLVIALAFREEKPTKQTPSQLSQTKEQKVTYVFDIPSLVDKNIDEVRERLGAPTNSSLEPSSKQKALGIIEWSNTFSKNNAELVVTFNSATRQIIDFFIPTDNPSGMTNDTQHLLELGHLELNSDRYQIEFVKAIKQPSSYTGVKIIPGPYF
ncbi:hypothetical protein J7K05_00525 [bacterium]|nr:hypothetical protein [bacterium]